MPAHQGRILSNPETTEKPLSRSPRLQAPWPISRAPPAAPPWPSSSNTSGTTATSAPSTRPRVTATGGLNTAPRAGASSRTCRSTIGSTATDATHMPRRRRGSPRPPPRPPAPQRPRALPRLSRRPLFRRRSRSSRARLPGSPVSSLHQHRRAAHPPHKVRASRPRPPPRHPRGSPQQRRVLNPGPRQSRRRRSALPQRLPRKSKPLRPRDPRSFESKSSG